MDYSSETVYFITIVTKNRECLFGSIEDDKMILNEKGRIIETELLKSIKIRENWFFHNGVIMPNHIHLLIEIQNGNISNNDLESTTHIVEAYGSASLRDNRDEKKSESNLGRRPNSISSFVAIFKSITTKQINGSESIWQANYHDHLVKNYKRFETIYSYIKNNPRSWETDSINSKFQ